MASLNSMLQKELHNEVPDTVLRQCPEGDRVLVENVLRLTQVELVVLNLASTTVALEPRKTVLKCALRPAPSVSLSSMLSLQEYSPVRVLEVRTTLHDGSMLLVLEIRDGKSRIRASKLEIVRITKRRRLVDRMFSLGPA
jgi:hypothetical protein